MTESRKKLKEELVKYVENDRSYQIYQNVSRTRSESILNFWHDRLEEYMRYNDPDTRIRDYTPAEVRRLSAIQDLIYEALEGHPINEEVP